MLAPKVLRTLVVWVSPQDYMPYYVYVVNPSLSVSTAEMDRQIELFLRDAFQKRFLGYIIYLHIYIYVFL